MRMTGGEALAKQLQREGVRVVFGLPGVQLYGAMAALRDVYALLSLHAWSATLLSSHPYTGGQQGAAAIRDTWTGETADKGDAPA